MERQKKILIVEDELLERKALQEIIIGHFGNSVSVAVSGDYDDAYELVFSFKPQIIIMDIHLGSGNGLELSKEILSEKPDTQIIILTAYDYSHYSRQAISIGIKDFILKPSSKESVIKAVQKRIESIQKEERRVQDTLKSRNTLIKAIPLLKKQFLNGLWYDQLSTDEIRNYLDTIGLQIKSFYCIAVQIDEEDSENQQVIRYDEKAILLKKISKMIEGQSGTENVIQHQVDQDTLLVLVNFIMLGSEYEVRERIIKSIQQLKNKTVQLYGVSFHAGISKTHHNYRELNTAIEETKIATKEQGVVSICHYSDLLLYDSEVAYPKSIEQNILQVIAKGNVELIEEAFYCFLNESGRFGFGVSREFMMRMIVTVIERYSTMIYGGKFTGSLNINELIAMTAQAKNFKELELCALKLLHKLSDVLGNGNISNKEQIIEKAIKYINIKYKEDISLEDIAEAIHISQYYLSRIFKQVVKMNISQYLTRVRLDYAKKFLLETQMPIKEISIECGFNDPNYFCKVFKKHFGTSPSEYRNNRIGVQ